MVNLRNVGIVISDLAKHEHVPVAFLCSGRVELVPVRQIQSWAYKWFVRDESRDVKILTCWETLQATCHERVTCWSCGAEYQLGEVNTPAKSKQPRGPHVVLVLPDGTRLP